MAPVQLASEPACTLQRHDTSADWAEDGAQVDCAYYTDDEIEVNEDPTASVKKSMEAKGLGSLESACPTCFNNQRALWCAQTVPKCGSYSATIEQVLLPAL